jgi:hypothetical protein
LRGDKRGINPNNQNLLISFALHRMLRIDYESRSSVMEVKGAISTIALGLTPVYH